MDLTSDNVQAIIGDCMGEDENNPDGIKVEGIVNNYWLDKTKLESHRDEIRSMIEDVPTEFLAKGGGGWSFLNLCMTAGGIQWTGLHLMQERLYVLAAGLGMAKFQLPRALWSALPGSVPYIVFDPEGGLGE